MDDGGLMTGRLEIETTGGRAGRDDDDGGEDDGWADDAWADDGRR